MSTWHEKLANRKQNHLDEERKKKVEVNDISFPSLGNAGSAWGSGKKEETGPETKPKLASLVAKWDEDAKMMAEREAARQHAQQDRAGQSEHIGFLHSRYYFGNTHSRDEDTYYEEEEDNIPPPPSADTSSDWRTIERPVRKLKKSATDRMMTDIQEAPVEDSFVWREDEASVWGADRS